MAVDFQSNALPTLIGSLPMENHRKAMDLVLRYTPEIPLWVQLPANREEGMMRQFLPGLPGFCSTAEKTHIDAGGEQFETELLAFYEDYIAVTEGEADLTDSRFALTPETAEGFFALLDRLDKAPSPPYAVKGQITGPVTLGTGLPDQENRAVFYDERLRDVLIKHLALKARWQVRQLSRYDLPVILFFDEPALTGFGSSAFISISREEIAVCFNEVIQAVHLEGGLAGIHVCANAEWSLVLDSPADIVSFDAYAFFDRFILYPEEIKRFMARGGILAWGIVPTLEPDDLAAETASSLLERWEKEVQQVEALGIDRQTIVSQSLITPACGTGSLSPELAERALQLTGEVSAAIRNQNPSHT